MLPSSTTRSNRLNSLLGFARNVFKGIGQIMLQDNAFTGILFLIGITSGSIVMGLGALIATICGTVTAVLFKFGKDRIGSGLYGFSAALVGVAMMLFLQPTLGSWLLLCIGAIGASMIQHFFIQRNIPVFTLPFVLVTWAIILLVNYIAPELLAVESSLANSSVTTFGFALRGYGQVIFQEGIVAGLLFFIAVYVNSPKSAMIGLVAAVFSGLLAELFVLPSADIAIGLWSYNAVLCAIALGGTTVKDGLWVGVAVFISVIIQIIMAKNGLLALTFPFVTATVIVLGMKGMLKK